MATKKQKREAALAKHNQEMADLAKSNAQALEKERARRAHEWKKAWQKQHDTKHNWKNRIKECPLCEEIVKANQAKPVKTDLDTLFQKPGEAIDMRREQTAS